MGAEGALGRGFASILRARKGPALTGIGPALDRRRGGGGPVVSSGRIPEPVAGVGAGEIVFSAPEPTVGSSPRWVVRSDCTVVGVAASLSSGTATVAVPGLPLLEVTALDPVVLDVSGPQLSAGSAFTVFVGSVSDSARGLVVQVWTDG